MRCLCPAPISPRNRDCSCLSYPPLPTTRRYVPKADHQGAGRDSLTTLFLGSLVAAWREGRAEGTKREERCWLFLRSLNWAGGGSAWREICVSHGPQHHAPWRDLPILHSLPLTLHPTGLSPPTHPGGSFSSSCSSLHLIEGKIEEPSPLGPLVSGRKHPLAEGVSFWGCPRLL